MNISQCSLYWDKEMSKLTENTDNCHMLAHTVFSWTKGHVLISKFWRFWELSKIIFSFILWSCPCSRTPLFCAVDHLDRIWVTGTAGGFVFGCLRYSLFGECFQFHVIYPRPWLWKVVCTNENTKKTFAISVTVQSLKVECPGNRDSHNLKNNNLFKLL